MNDDRTERVARNQALYREVNERIEDLNESFGGITGAFLIVCECSDPLCTEQIALSRQAYERTRAHPAQFIVRPGHQAVALEDIITTEAEYMVVEKHAGEPARLAGKTDPRH